MSLNSLKSKLAIISNFNKGIDMQTITLNIKDDYYDKFKALLDALPKNAMRKAPQKSLKDEIKKRVKGYQNGSLKTKPFEEGLDDIRAKIASKCR